MQEVFTETRVEDVDCTKTQPCMNFVYMERANPSQEQFTVTLFDCNHLAHMIVLWQMRKLMCYCTVFALFYFEVKGNFQEQALGGLYLEEQFNGGFFGLRVWGAYIRRGLFLEFYGICTDAARTRTWTHRDATSFPELRSFWSALQIKRIEAPGL